MELKIEDAWPETFMNRNGKCSLGNSYLTSVSCPICGLRFTKRSEGKKNGGGRDAPWAVVVFNHVFTSYRLKTYKPGGSGLTSFNPGRVGHLLGDKL